MTFNYPLIAAAFVTGLLGSVHCIGMCGGIIGALSVAPATAPVRRRWFPLLYHVGRIVSYAAAGAAAGVIGGTVLDATALARVTGIGAIIAGLFMIALGLYLASWWRGLAALERLGGKLWRVIEPYGRALLPARRPHQALLLGMLWGWLPCGMVYSALAGAAVGGDAVNGALIMLMFGLGTAPLLWALGGGVRHASAVSRLRWHTLAAVGLIAMGGYVALRPMFGDACHDPHAGHAAATNNHTRDVGMPASCRAAARDWHEPHRRASGVTRRRA